MRISRRVRRVVAATTAATIAMLVPAAPAVAAQPKEPDYDDGVANAEPPPFDESWPLINADGQPDVPYTRKTDNACVASLQEETQLRNEPWAQDVLRLTEAHQYATGSGVTVAVIDTGVNDHSFLTGRLLPKTVDYVSAEAPNDCDGHGTQVAGIIAANTTGKDIGFTGVAPDATIMSIRQSSEYFEYKDPNGQNNRATAGNLDSLAEAIVTATDSGANVINMSIDACRSANKDEITDQEKTVRTALKYAVDHGVVPVVSAGNKPNNEDCGERQNSPDPDNPTLIVAPPWFSDVVLSVAAVQRDGATADFSIHGPWISVGAPGTEIISLNPADPDGLVNQTSDGAGKQPVPIQGTSFAAPYVAGLAALLKQRFPNLSAQQIMHRIKATAQHPAGPGGRNLEVGYGMIDPVAALTEVIPGEENIKGDEPIELPSDVPPPYEHNWAPMQVALAGSGGGLVLLLLTLFIVHTVRRNRPDGALKR
jgi:membrane-anchored mycosin MYCP